jgi:competence protein ComGC
MTKNKKGFSISLLELLIVIAIIGILVAMPRPMVRKERIGESRKRVCYSNIRILQGAVEMYNMDVATMTNILDQEELRKSGYIKGSADLTCPESYKKGTYSGTNLTEDGEIICSYHGGLKTEGEYDRENR